MSDSQELRFEVVSGEDDRIDRLLARRYPRVGRRRWSLAIGDGQVKVNGRVVRKSQRVEVGAAVVVARMPPVGAELAPVARADGDLQLLLERDDFLVVNKSPGLACHPLAAEEMGTVANLVAAHYPECLGASDDPREGGLAHRLDRGTSGALVFARDHRAWKMLRQAFGNRKVSKHYLAIVIGDAGSGQCDAPLVTRGRRSVVASEHDKKALSAATEWRTLSQANGLSLVRVLSLTGRMHQVRVHLSSQGLPLLGDPTYGGPGQWLVAQETVTVGLPLLHAESLSWVWNGEPVRVYAPIPAERAQLVARLGFATLPTGLDH